MVVAQDRQSADVIRTAKTGADSCRLFYLPGGPTYFFPSKAWTIFTNPDARLVPTPTYDTCGYKYCVEDDGGAAWPGVLVALATTKTGSNYVQTGRTDAAGCVVFVDVEPGTYYAFRTLPLDDLQQSR